jgi:hypothetical protein
MRARTASAEWDDPSQMLTRPEVATLPQILPEVRRAAKFVLGWLGIAIVVVAGLGWLAT